MSDYKSRTKQLDRVGNLFGATEAEVIEFVESMLDELAAMICIISIPPEKMAAIECNIAVIKGYLRHQYPST